MTRLRMKMLACVTAVAVAVSGCLPFFGDQLAPIRDHYDLQVHEDNTVSGTVELLGAERHLTVYYEVDTLDEALEQVLVDVDEFERDMVNASVELLEESGDRFGYRITFEDEPFGEDGFLFGYGLRRSGDMYVYEEEGIDLWFENYPSEMVVTTTMSFPVDITDHDAGSVRGNTIHLNYNELYAEGVYNLFVEALPR